MQKNKTNKQKYEWKKDKTMESVKKAKAGQRAKITNWFTDQLYFVRLICN